MSDVGFPVDIRVPVHQLKMVKRYLNAYDIQFSTMIKDLQVAYDTWNQPGLTHAPGFEIESTSLIEVI